MTFCCQAVSMITRRAVNFGMTALTMRLPTPKTNNYIRENFKNKFLGYSQI